jgi:hypothetical protein
VRAGRRFRRDEHEKRNVGWPSIESNSTPVGAHRARTISPTAPSLRVRDRDTFADRRRRKLLAFDQHARQRSRSMR